MADGYLELMQRRIQSVPVPRPVRFRFAGFLNFWIILSAVFIICLNAVMVPVYIENNSASGPGLTAGFVMYAIIMFLIDLAALYFLVRFIVMTGRLLRDGMPVISRMIEVRLGSGRNNDNYYWDVKYTVNGREYEKSFDGDYKAPDGVIILVDQQNPANAALFGKDYFWKLEDVI